MRAVFGASTGSRMPCTPKVGNPAPNESSTCVDARVVHGLKTRRIKVEKSLLDHGEILRPEMADRGLLDGLRTGLRCPA